MFALSLLDHRIGRGEGFITDVAVLNDYRRQGIAGVMLARAEQEAQSRHKHYLGLYVSGANMGARTLYRRLGFRDMYVRRSWLTRLIFGQREWVYMRKHLT
jgi:ribosomal protein S18 acetylase RimI-like enzyme